MKIFKKIFALTFALLMIFSVSACKKQNDEFSLSGFNTQITISVSGKVLSQKIKNDVKNLISSLEKEFSTSVSNSFTTRFNSTSNNQPISASDVALEILSTAKTAYLLSNGSFDPTVYPLVALWGFADYKYTATFNPPKQQDIASDKKAVCFDFVKINAQEKIVYKTMDGVKMDFGGVVKGYAVDEIAKILKNNGYSAGYVSVGSSSLNLLSVEKLSVRHPRKTAEIIYEINLKGKTDLSVSTSGDYEKFHLTTNGEKFCHIIDPKTGYPTQKGVASATILGVDGALSDALTTALCLKNYSTDDKECELIKFIAVILENYPLSSIYVVYQKDDNKVIITNKKQGEDFTLLDDEYEVVNV